MMNKQFKCCVDFKEYVESWDIDFNDYLNEDKKFKKDIFNIYMRYHSVDDLKRVVYEDIFAPILTGLSKIINKVVNHLRELNAD